MSAKAILPIQNFEDPVVIQRGKAATNIWFIEANAFAFMILPSMILQNPE